MRFLLNNENDFFSVLCADGNWSEFRTISLIEIESPICELFYKIKYNLNNTRSKMVKLKISKMRNNVYQIVRVLRTKLQTS